ncbi:hypothetical protein B0H12DRAFT_1149638 [Mycena haematopus]|nr:hypothetical protein B0H12DRAFT_1149638 [Mycena haematopus]
MAARPWQETYGQHVPDLCPEVSRRYPLYMGCMSQTTLCLWREVLTDALRPVPWFLSDHIDEIMNTRDLWELSELISAFCVYLHLLHFFEPCQGPPRAGLLPS